MFFVATLLGEIIAILDWSMVLLVPIFVVYGIVRKKIVFTWAIFLFALMAFLVTDNAVRSRDYVWNQKNVHDVFRVDSITKKPKFLEYVVSNKNKKYLIRDTSDCEKWKIGNLIDIKGQVKQFDRARNKGNFDARQYYMSLGIYATIEVESASVADGSYNVLFQFLYNCRKRFKKIIQIECNNATCSNKLVQNKEGVYEAVLLGDKSELDEELRDLYSAVGIAHILAISGLHISIIGMMIYRLLRRRFSFGVSAAVSIVMVAMFSIISGLGIATIRAFIMFGLRLIGEVMGRKYDAFTAICLSGMILLINNPFIFYNQSFVMSFVAIYGISVLWPCVVELFDLDRRIEDSTLDKKSVDPTKVRRLKIKKFKQKIINSMLFSFFVSMFMAPTIAYYYYALPTYSFVLNIVVVPLMTVVVLSGIISIMCVLFVVNILGVIGGLGINVFDVAGFNLGAIIVTPGGLVLEIYELVSKSVNSWVGSSIVVGTISVKAVAAIYILWSIGLVVLVKYKNVQVKLLQENQKQYGPQGKSIARIKTEKMAVFGLKKRLAVVWAAGVLTLVGALYCAVTLRALGITQTDIATTFVDVGQGDGILMKLPHDVNVCVDGGSTTVKNVAKYRIVPYLKAAGVGVINYQVVTHGDLDHLSGVMEMLEDENCPITIKNLVIPHMNTEDETLQELVNMAQKRKVNIIRLSTNDRMQIGDCTIKCLSPRTDADYEDKNDYSIVLSVVMQDYSMLLTGDLTSEVEPEVTQLIDKPYTVLKVGHHGSKYSSTEEFLEKVSPTYSIISSGKGNRYGHPTKEVLERLEHIGSQYIRTDEKGGITITTNGHSAEIETTLE